VAEANHVKNPRGDGRLSLNMNNPGIGRASLNTHLDDRPKPQRGVGEKRPLKPAKIDQILWTWRDTGGID
jgi:hypothetical protein